MPQRWNEFYIYFLFSENRSFATRIVWVAFKSPARLHSSVSIFVSASAYNEQLQQQNEKKWAKCVRCTLLVHGDEELKMLSLANEALYNVLYIFSVYAISMRVAALSYWILLHPPHLLVEINFYALHTSWQLKFTAIARYGFVRIADVLTGWNRLRHNTSTQTINTTTHEDDKVWLRWENREENEKNDAGTDLSFIILLHLPRVK